MKIYFWTLLTLSAASAAAPSATSATAVTAPSLHHDGSSLIKNQLSGSTHIHSGLKDRSLVYPAYRSSWTSRGGSSPSLSLWTPQSQRELSGALVFIILDKAFRSFFTANKIAFPSQLGGCIVVFASLVLSEMLKAGSGEAVLQVLAPGAALLAKWLPVFFVPGLAMLPLAPSMGGPLEGIKVLGVVVVGFFYTLSTSAFSVLALRKLQGATSTASSVKTSTNVSPASKVASNPPQPYSPQLVRFLYIVSPVAAAISISATKFNHPWAQPLYTLCMIFTTVTGYVWGAHLPQNIVKIIHPLVSSTAITLLVTKLMGLITGPTFLQMLAKYKVGSLSLMKTGAGDILLYLLGPCVVSFAIPMFSRRKVMVDNLLPVITSMVVASIGGLFGTAAFVRLLQVGGSRIGSHILRISLLSRNVTTPLAIAITNLLGGEISIAAAVVVLTGIFGATFGARILTAWNINDSVSRGLSIGAAAQGLGVASFINEKDAFPFAAISMVLTAVAATTLVSIPMIKSALLNIAGGN